MVIISLIGFKAVHATEIFTIEEKRDIEEIEEKRDIEEIEEKKRHRRN